MNLNLLLLMNLYNKGLTIRELGKAILRYLSPWLSSYSIRNLYTLWS